LVSDRPQKIAVIGATDYKCHSSEVLVESFPWHALKKSPNLADYDVVVLNLLSLDDPMQLDYSAVRKVLDVRVAQEVLRKRDGAIFVLGDPRFTMKVKRDGTEQDEPFLCWTGVEFFWDERAGDTLERRRAAIDGPFKPFADKLVRWRYSLTGCRPDEEGFASVWDVETMQEKRQHPTAELNKICENSYGNALVFTVAHAVEGPTHSRYSGTATQRLSNPMCFLPESTLREDEALEFVLRDLCGVNISAPEPPWITEFVAPGQNEVDHEILELEDRIHGLIEERDQLVEKRAELRTPLKLLYETGAALEEAVRTVLEALGVEVERPEEDRANEDGWIRVLIDDEIFEGVLEVKGVKSKHFNLEGLRQLTDWIERGRTYRKKTYTGIFVGNSAREEPPRLRMWPFNKNWIEQAEMRGYAAIRSEDLYVLYLLDRTSRLDRNALWRGLFSTKGPFNMRPYWAGLSEEEKNQLSGPP
jgi:hypothetical protein